MMKKLLFIFLLFTLLLSLTISLNATNEPKDSRLADAALQEELEVCRSREFSGEKKDLVILQMYSGVFLYDFAAEKSIEDICNSSLETYYVSATDEQGTHIRMDFLYDVPSWVSGEKFHISVLNVDTYYLFQKAFLYQEMFQSVEITKGLQDLEVLKLYCLDGSKYNSGIFIYYITNHGDYVYYKPYAEHALEYIFPSEVFCKEAAPALLYYFQGIKNYADLFLWGPVPLSKYIVDADAVDDSLKDSVITLPPSAVAPSINKPKQTTTTTTALVTTTTTPAPVPQNESNPLRYWLIPVAIVAVGGAVGLVWYRKRKRIE